MKSLRAVLDLVLRPLTLLLLSFVAIVSATQLQEVGGVSEVMTVLRPLWHGTPTPAMIAAWWQALAIVPAGLGVIVAMNRLNLQHTTQSWHLPGLGRRLLAGTAALAAAVAFPLAVFTSRVAPPSVTIAAFCLAFYAFLVPGLVFDKAVPLAARILLPIPLLAMILRPGASAQMAATYPVPIAALSLTLAAAHLPAIASARMARLRPFRWSVFHASGALYWASRRVRRADWRHPLTTERLVPWLRAAAHQSPTRYPLPFLLSASIAVVLARLVDAPAFLPMLAGSIMMTPVGLQLKPRLPYPLSRARRAQLAYAGTITDAAIYFGILAAMLALSSLLPLPRLPFIDREASRAIAWVLMPGCAFALIPIAQWGGLLWPDAPTKRQGTMHAGLVALFVTYVLAVAFAAYVIGRAAGDDLPRTLIAIGAAALATQVIHAALVHSHFTTADLLSAHNTR